MKMLSDEMSVGSVKEITTHFEGNPGYTIVLGYGEMLIGESVDFVSDFEDDSEVEPFESILCEMPENDYHKYDGDNCTALYGVRRSEETTDDTFICNIVRIK